MIIYKKENIYSRTANVLYENGIPLIKFTFSKFTDWDVLSEQGVKYMNKYMAMWPNYWEVYVETNQEQTGQISLLWQ